MSVGPDTYADDMVTLCGGENIFKAVAVDAGSHGDAARYPKTTLERVRELAPQVILLPDEPYVFGDSDRAELLDMLHDVPAVRDARVHLVRGSLLTWYGPQVAEAIATLEPLCRPQI